MSNTQQASSCSFYTYVYGDDLTRTSRRFHDTHDTARRDIVTFRRELLAENGRYEPEADWRLPGGATAKADDQTIDLLCVREMAWIGPLAARPLPIWSAQIQRILGEDRVRRC